MCPVLCVSTCVSLLISFQLRFLPVQKSSNGKQILAWTQWVNGPISMLYLSINSINQLPSFIKFFSEVPMLLEDLLDHHIWTWIGLSFCQVCKGIPQLQAPNLDSRSYSNSNSSKYVWKFSLTSSNQVIRGSPKAVGILHYVANYHSILLP